MIIIYVSEQRLHVTDPYSVITFMMEGRKRRERRDGEREMLLSSRDVVGSVHSSHHLPVAVRLHECYTAEDKRASFSYSMYLYMVIASTSHNIQCACITVT